jgi:hypothetical protein
MVRTTQKVVQALYLAAAAHHQVIAVGGAALIRLIHGGPLVVIGTVRVGVVCQ